MADPVWLDNWRQANGWPVISEDPEVVLSLMNSAELPMTPELQTYLILRLMLKVMTP